MEVTRGTAVDWVWQKPETRKVAENFEKVRFDEHFFIAIFTPTTCVAVCSSVHRDWLRLVGVRFRRKQRCHERYIFPV